ncbi:MAG: tryptophan 2,3-dioxygenase family protein, partial [Gemmatimonadota bacterium]
LGQKRPAALDRYPDEEAVTQGLQARFRQPSLWDSFLAYLAKNGYDVPKELLQRDTTQSTEPSPDVQKILIDIYRNDPAVAPLCERLVDLDEGLQEWRYRHVKMVERTIGTKPGTGGSTGTKYLKTTLFDPVFPDLWAIRTEL